ncbi:hypothetical protein SNEBB_000724, partial [Seison nebaliae]
EKATYFIVFNTIWIMLMKQMAKGDEDEDIGNQLEKLNYHLLSSYASYLDQLFGIFQLKHMEIKYVLVHEIFEKCHDLF